MLTSESKVSENNLNKKQIPMIELTPGYPNEAL